MLPQNWVQTLAAVRGLKDEYASWSTVTSAPVIRSVPGAKGFSIFCFS